MSIDKRAQGKRNRRFGHDWERQLVQLCKERGFDAVRVTSEPKHGNLGDVLVRHPLYPILFQCKAGKQPNPRTAIDQAEEAAMGRAGNWYPVGATYEASGPGSAAVRRVHMDIGTFLDLYAAATGAVAGETNKEAIKESLSKLRAELDSVLLTLS